MQTEYEEECGVTFGKCRLRLAKSPTWWTGKKKPIGREAAEVIKTKLVEQKMLDTEGRIQPTARSSRKDFKLELPEPQKELVPAVVDLLASYQIERHIRKEKEERVNRLKKEVTLSPEFKALWDRIKAKTTYRVEFETDVLVGRAVDAIKRMERIESPKILVRAGQVAPVRGGVTTAAVSVAEETVSTDRLPVPDVLAYLQNETEPCSTLVRILKESGRLAELFIDPQRFMDAVAHILKYELHPAPGGRDQVREDRRQWF